MPSNPAAAAARIRAALAERDEDAITVARATGLDKAVLYGLLNGQRWPRPASRAKIERYFGWEAGTLERAAETETPTTAGQVVLHLDADTLADLSPLERDEATAAAVASFMERARQIRAFRS